MRGRTADIFLLGYVKPELPYSANRAARTLSPLYRDDVWFDSLGCRLRGGMTETARLYFPLDRDGRLPLSCSIDTSCYDDPVICDAITATIKQIFDSLAVVGIDLCALDGVTFTGDCRMAASSLQQLSEGQAPTELSRQPDTMEMGRTVAVWRDGQLRFHIVLRAEVGLMVLSSEENDQALAHACIAHEAAHIDHEGHLYRTFSDVYGRPLECGDRSRKTFLKAMDVWSEYAACRTSAMFRPEAVEEFEGIFCRALEECSAVCKDHLAAHKRDGNAAETCGEIPLISGDAFICAGYFLGHLDGLELDLEENAPRVATLLRQHAEIEMLVARLNCALRELWLSEPVWKSIEVFAPIYDLICEMMALHGFVLVQREAKWQIVLCEDAAESTESRF